jgi:small subunit ribosomal protein S17
MNKQLTAIIVSTKMNKTIVVSVERKFRHSFYKKVIIRNKKYKVHNEIEGLAVGDMVIIQEVAPISAQKHFKVVSRATKEQVS